MCAMCCVAYSMDSCCRVEDGYNGYKSDQVPAVRTVVFMAKRVIGHFLSPESNFVSASAVQRSAGSISSFYSLAHEEFVGVPVDKVRAPMHGCAGVGVLRFLRAQ